MSSPNIHDQRALQQENNKSYHSRRLSPTPGTVAYRAVQLRRAVAPSAAAFCRLSGINYRRWHNVERGHPCSRLLADTIARRWPGLPVEWLPYGNTDRMPLYWHERLFGRANGSQGPSGNDLT